jgi:hypothetical protein
MESKYRKFYAGTQKSIDAKVTKTPKKQKSGQLQYYRYIAITYPQYNLTLSSQFTALFNIST